MKTLSSHFEIIIIGAGLTGLTLAIALAELNLKIAIVDNKSSDLSLPNAVDLTELRALALSYGSQMILSRLGLWDMLQQQVTPIKHVHVTDRGHFGMVRIHASDYQLPCLGSVISMQVLQQKLLAKAKQYKNIHWFQPAGVHSTDISDDTRRVTLIISGEEMVLRCNLLISAEGQHSSVRQLLQLKEKRTDYQQTAIVTNVGVARQHDYTAYERFTSSGPLALLPISELAFSLVWTVKPDRAAILMAMSQAEFLISLQKSFGYRVGQFIWLGQRQSFPLSLVQLNTIIAERALVIGNAAHTLHPIAGQGFNLALRDVAILIQEIQQLIKTDKLDIYNLLRCYEAKRIEDYKKTICLTDGLVKIFSNDFSPLAFLRNLGMLGFDITFLKHTLARTLMGMI